MRKNIDEWVKSHHNVVHSPIKRDSILCPDPTPDDLIHTVRRNNILLQCSFRESHNDLYKQGIGLPELVIVDGKKQVSDTVFRQMLPFELRPMSKYLKQMCCCMICESFDFKHGALKKDEERIL